MTSLDPFVMPLYIFIFFIIALLYLAAAFVIGVIAAALTLPVLSYSGYGLVPPRFAPATATTRLRSAAIIQLALGGTFGATSIVATFFTGLTIPFMVTYQFGRVSPRLETVPELASGTGLVLAVWIGYLFVARVKFAGDDHDGWIGGLLGCIRAAVVFGICFLAVAVLSTFTLYL